MMKHVHLIGIGGTGMSSIARVLAEKGYVVSGSDKSLSALALDLVKAGVSIYEDHAAENIAGADMVVRSSAISDDNPEVLAARSNSIPVLKRQEFLGSLLENENVLAVAGSHGKTTTSAMLAWVLTKLGDAPGFILGGVSANLGKNATAGNGKYFVIEADEYDHMFLGLNPSMILLTSVDYDHPDCFPTTESYISVFREFVGRLKPLGTLVTNSDNDAAATMRSSLPAETNCLTYGIDNPADFVASNLHINQFGGFSFYLSHKDSGLPLSSVDLQVPGKHNVSNALAVLASVHQMKIPIEQASQAISEFKGTGRRFEVIGELDGITVIDDYAHHPAKIEATLKAARLRYPGKRLVVVWQPHTYSRTRALEADFIRSLKFADSVIITDVYASREPYEDFPVNRIAKQLPDAIHISGLDDCVDYLLTHLRSNDILLVLSAGDANIICTRIVQNLQERKNQHG